MKKESLMGGYFTLEAALVFPVVFGVILLVMQIWFFKYDRVLMTMDATSVVIRAGEQREMSSDELADYVLSEMQNRYKDHYIAWNFGSINISTTSDTVNCTVDGTGMDIPGGFAFWRIGTSLYATVTRSRTTVSEVFVIRSYRKALGVSLDISESLKSE